MKRRSAPFYGPYGSGRTLRIRQNCLLAHFARPHCTHEDNYTALYKCFHRQLAQNDTTAGLENWFEKKPVFSFFLIFKNSKSLNSRF